MWAKAYGRRWWTKRVNATEERSGLDQVWLTPQQVMARTGFGRTEVYAALRSRELPSSQSGPRGRYRIRAEDADEWVQNRRAKT
jgi:excisionase family DNA binding protein